MAMPIVRGSRIVQGLVSALIVAASGTGTCNAQDLIVGLDSLKTDQPTQVLVGGPSLPAIPQGFFGPGSDPFIGSVCLIGSPLSPLTTGTTDTIIRRVAGTTGISGPPPASAPVPIEIVSLSLVSCQPIVVTNNGGQNPQQWNVQVGLSSVVPPAGTMTVRKTHSNGGTWDSVLPVQPKLIFIQVLNPLNIRVLDTGTAGLPPIMLHVDPVDNVPWSYSPPPLPEVPGMVPNFYPGVPPTGGPRQPFRLHTVTGDVLHTVELASVCLVDLNHDGQITPVDIAIYVNSWFAALVNGC